jgi:hypothetical protein
MDNQVIYKLMEEIRLQCRFSQAAFQNIRSNLAGLDQEKTFFFVHAFLGHAVRISRLLWPEREGSAARGETLRCELKAGEQGGLRMRNLRPLLEREDEWLEDWMGTLENKNYVEMNLMPMGTMAGFRQDSFQRDLDPDTYQMVYRGELIDLRLLLQEIRQMEAAVQQWFKTSKPW